MTIKIKFEEGRIIFILMLIHEMKQLIVLLCCALFGTTD